MGIGVSNNEAEGTAGVKVTNNQLHIKPETDAANNATNVGGVRTFSENDAGTITGVVALMSPEIDLDYRQRTASDIMLDEEIFNYTAQNTGKHTYGNTTMTLAWSVGAVTTNSGNVTTTTIGAQFGTYAYFPIIGTHTLSIDVEGSFTSLPCANTIIDFGLFLRGASNPFAPSDGAYFRLTSAGLQGVSNYNGNETFTSIFPVSSTDATPWSYTINKKYQFIVYITPRVVEFWINDNGNVNMMGSINTPVGYGQPCASSALPFSMRHAIVGGAAGAVMNFNLARYNVRLGGSNLVSSLAESGNRAYGSYQGFSGGTMGSLSYYVNNANPTPAILTNTSASTNLAGGLGGQSWEVLAAGLNMNTDGILCSYLNPAGTVSVQGRRLVIKGIKCSSFLQLATSGGGFVNTFTLAYGHTSPSLATSEAATAKAPRRILLPELTQSVSTTIITGGLIPQAQASGAYFDNPIYVNPGEYVALVVKHIGTSFSTGVIAYNIQYDYGWE